MLTVAVGGLVMVTTSPAGANHWLCISAVEVVVIVVEAAEAAAALVMMNLAPTFTPAEVTVRATSSASVNLAIKAKRKALASNEETSPASANVAVTRGL